MVFALWVLVIVIVCCWFWLGFAVDYIRVQGEEMSTQLDALTAQVAANTDAERAAVVLITRLADLIIAGKDDPEALVKLASELKASADALAAATVGNTPPGPLPPTP